MRVREMLRAHRSASAALLAVVLHLPFVIRYDLHFQPDFAISMMMSRSILEGERPVFFWGQAYLGTYGNYLTAMLFWLFGVSVPLAGLLSLAIWAVGVGLTTWLAERLLDDRVVGWVGISAAIASPYANHYATQPYSSYETAPVLAILVFAGLLWARRLWQLPLGPWSAAGWMGLGLLAGMGWWTTRLFLPVAAAAALAVALRAPWRGSLARHAAPRGVLLLIGLLVGASPDLAYRLGYLPHETVGPLGTSQFELGIASPSQVPENLRQAFASLPAYFNGDPLARVPEGFTFAWALWKGESPYAAWVSSSILVAVLDWIVLVVVVAVLFAAARTALRAWRVRDVPLLALSLTPFLHLAFIGLSGRTNGGYFEARRYWYASLLVFPLLFGNALAETGRTPPWRIGTRVIAGLLLASSAVAQARMLALPDELADFRVLVRDLEASGQRAVLMPEAAWFVTGLSGGEIAAACFDGRRPELVRQVAASARVAVVVPASQGFEAPGFRLQGRHFSRDGLPQRAGMWEWIPFRADAEPAGP